MYIVRIIPLAKMPASAPGVFDYFWLTPLSHGSIVEATIGRRHVLALVVECLDLRSAKLALKKSTFALKKLDGVVTETPQIHPIQIAMAQWMATYYGTSIATCIKTVTPPFLGKKKKLIDLPIPNDIPKKNPPPPGHLVLTEPHTTLIEIRRIASKTAHQLFILVPEVSLAIELAQKLSSLHPLVIHSATTPRNYESAYRSVAAGSAKIIIGTRSALFLPWASLEAIIVEDPLNEAYKSDMSPRYNGPDAARTLAALTGASLTWLTPAISTVHHHLISTGTLTIEDRKPYWPQVISVSMEQEQLDGGRSLFSRKATEELLECYTTKKPILILSARRGYATVARCGQCRKAIPCANCSTPMRWHRTSEDMLVCYHCAAYIQVPKQCPACQSGTLGASGIPGSQKLAEAVNTILDRHGYTKLSIPILDSDLVTTASDEQRVLEKYDVMEHPLLVASQMIFSHRYTRTFNTVIIPQLDALSYNPDYRTQERLLLQLEKVADMHPKTLIVQSWDDTDALGNIRSRQWDTFYTSELAHRKSLLWPPFARIVKLSLRHRDKATATRYALVAIDKMKRAVAHLQARGTRLLGPSPALVERSGGLWTQIIIIKSALSGNRLAELLSFVPEQWTIDVDPRSIT